MPCADCQVDNGRFYGGTTAVTSTGRTCQRWDSQTPHQHTWTHANHPTSRLEENYCRNPDPTNRVQPWCLTTDPGPVREKCEVPPCVCTSKTTDDGYWYRWDSLLITSPYLFLVQAGSDVHIGLASSNGDLDATYEFVIGGWGNLRSAIRRVPQGANMISHTTVDILSPTEYRAFWLIWSPDGRIAVQRFGDDLPFLEWTDPDPRPVSYIGYSTGFGHTGLWQLCEANGQWGAWGGWTACSVPCGFGLQTRRRVCDNPIPVPPLGKACEGQTEGSTLCYVSAVCSGGMDVASTVYILHIGTLSEKHANISVRLQYTLTWGESRLYGIAPSWVPVPPSLVWSPPLAFGQSVRRATAEEEADTSMWLDPRGLVVYKMTRLLTLSCVAKLERYPLDTQECQVVLHAYNGIRLRLQPSETGQNAPIKVDARGIVSQFVLVGAEQKAGFKSFRENVSGQFTPIYEREVCLLKGRKK
ncbi:semaphorin-5B-like [Branchiostoma floridae]|uniref:Semaphorin-5B-like n=1 Tax=Branchiostoma floridae TaxID=7739 RepID=A0A9J7KZ36_BRAFL|nr:semaphorin-5B-like [Branchiostoma floridae]